MTTFAIGAATITRIEETPLGNPLWSKCVNFSRRMKSSRSAGPRRPALSEFWLSAMGWPKFVVSGWPPQSIRTRSSGSAPGVTPSRAGAPVLAEVVASVSVLPVTLGSEDSAATPDLGVRAASPISAGLFGLWGNALASACMPCIFSAAGLPPFPAGPRRGPLTVDFAAPLPSVGVETRMLRVL
jgi:hypothetical protein